MRSEIRNEIWSLAASSFQHDDGSLPGIELANLLPGEVPALYEFLRDRSQIEGEMPTFWDHELEQNRPISSVENPASLVVSGRADCFHYCISGVSVAGTELPVLGVFVFPDSVELDYRMGENWRQAQVLGLFSLLKELLSLTHSATLRPTYDGPPDPGSFMAAWKLFNA
ncbi:hypothetical protein KR51_00018200 [Rubidibacter lacunae KORDI 51-2]|uniref:Uncharacterized protein n=1 Tax=Rubidibacter lacunae KORDI 51-2 TaxID=582515 RepID=U5DPJ4_9CHRO|nr:hypothetical protein [Rubidibacter lacunae]ERN41600.1 hypothetical protein KR51_00018200 [Rubidibacter lacunae KORDI 51-2]